MTLCVSNFATLFLVGFFFVVVVAVDEQLTRTEEKLTTDRDFYDQWMRLISLQAEQLSEQEADYPLDYILPDLAICPKIKTKSAEDANALEPSNVEFYAELGQLSSYCPSNYTLLKTGILGSCHQRTSQMTLPSLPSMLRQQGANLTIVESNQLEDLLTEQARSVAETIRAVPGQEEKWKLILIMATIQDGHASETGQTAVEVLSAVEELGKLLPRRTFIVVLRSSGSGIWHDASHTMQACKSQLEQWKMYSKFNYNSVWDQVRTIVEKNYKKTHFNVEVLPLFKEPGLNSLPDGMDMSVLGYDCAHFSQRGLSLLHLSIWNQLLTQNNNRSTQYRPNADPVLCPNPKCPFFRTAGNTVMCFWKPAMDFSLPVASHLIVAGVLLLTMLLACLILLFVCHSRRVSHEKSPIKSFGASFSSIKFIDEDVI